MDQAGGLVKLHENVIAKIPSQSLLNSASSSDSSQVPFASRLDDLGML